MLWSALSEIHLPKVHLLHKANDLMKILYTPIWNSASPLAISLTKAPWRYRTLANQWFIVFCSPWGLLALCPCSCRLQSKFDWQQPSNVFSWKGLASWILFSWKWQKIHFAELCGKFGSSSIWVVGGSAPFHLPFCPRRNGLLVVTSILVSLEMYVSVMLSMNDISDGTDAELIWPRVRMTDQVLAVYPSRMLRAERPSMRL